MSLTGYRLGNNSATLRATTATFAAAWSFVTPGLRTASVHTSSGTVGGPPTRAYVVDAVNVVGKKISAPLKRNRGGRTAINVRDVSFSLKVVPMTFGSRLNRAAHRRSLMRNVGGA